MTYSFQNEYDQECQTRPFTPVKEFMPTFYNPFETKHRRRTSRAQYKLLEASFEENTKPNAQMRRWLAQKLGMTPRSVQVWFQNRRAKAKSQQKRKINTVEPWTTNFDSLLTPDLMAWVSPLSSPLPCLLSPPADPILYPSFDPSFPLPLHDISALDKIISFQSFDNVDFSLMDPYTQPGFLSL